MKPLVSIIFPVYQVSDYVECSLKSVLRQTYRNIECIIVDDASPDDSIAKCERLIKEYNDNLTLKGVGSGRIMFKIIHHEVNRGLSAARNTGTDAATGDYLFYLDSDDEITPDCIEKLVWYVSEDDSIEMVQGSYVRIIEGREERHQTKDIKITNNEEARTQYLKYRNLNYTVWNKLLKRSFVIDNRLYNKEGILNEDLLWTFYLIKYLGKACLCNEITYYYLTRPDSIVTSTELKKRGGYFVLIYDEILHNLTPGKEKGELRGYLMNFCRLLAVYLREVPDFKRVLSLYKFRTKKYGCWRENITLSLFGLLCSFCNPYVLLEKLYHLRRKIVR